MKKYFLLFFVLSLILSSCFPYRKATRAMDSWNGHTKQELFSRWGAPNQVFPTDDGEIIVFYGNSKYFHNVVTGAVNASGTCKVQFFINRSEEIYNCSFENCGLKYLSKKGYR